MRTKSILILPCSMAKLDRPAQAFDLYQGKGYLSVVKKYTLLQLSEVFHVLFLSAKLGLIEAREHIEPYEQVMTNERSNLLVNDDVFCKSALSVLAKCQTDTIYSIMPKKYQAVLEQWLIKAETGLELNKPEPGSGIGFQRGYLSKILSDKISSINH